MRVLCTGGLGFVGSALTRRLVTEGHEVSVLDDFSRGSTQRLQDLIDSGDVRVHRGDMRQRGHVAHAVAGVDTIFHLAFCQGTQTFYTHPRTVVDVGLNGIVNLLGVCEKQQGKELILVSSSEAYQIPPPSHVPTDETVPLSVPDVTNPRYSYGGTKIACEVAAFAYADILRKMMVVRPHNLFGPSMGEEHVIPEFCRRFENPKPIQANGLYAFPIQGTGLETRSFCYIDDAVDGLVVAWEKGEHREIYHLGTTDEISIHDLALRMAQEYEVQIEVVPGKLPKGSPPRRLPDISKLRALGYRPRVSLEVGLARTVDWYRNNPRVSEAVTV